MSEEPTSQPTALQHLLGELEFAIMQIVWARGEVAVRDVWETLRQQRTLAYTTVMTVMSRLAQKGVLAIRKERKVYYYHATATPHELLNRRAEQAVEDVIATFGDVAVAQFLRSMEAMSPERIAALQKAIAKEQQDAR